MRVLMLHNFYRQPGGEDACFYAETEVLRRNGHEVSTIEMHNDAVAGLSAPALAMHTVWNRHSYAAVARRIAAFRPDVMHCHNIFPLLSPAVYYAAQRARIPVVQTLHNYRLLCLKAIMFRDGQICESCLNRTIPWRGVAHRCYHASVMHSASVASLLVAHRILGTWRRQVNLFLAVSAFTRDRYIAGGFDPARIMVKSNFLAVEPSPGDGTAGYALVVSRLSEEKGIATVIAAWSNMAGYPRLLIVGDGPLRSLEQTIPPGSPVAFLGSRTREEVYRLMGKAAFTIAASEWYETFGMTIIESLACGTPVLAARIGAYTELIQEGVTGFLFQSGDVDGLRKAVERLIRAPGTLRAMRRAARRWFVDNFSAQRNYQTLLAAYQLAARTARPSLTKAPGPGL